MPQSVDTIIFDLGGVLIDWNPRYLYRKILKSEEEVSWFLTNICTSEWNDMQDAGRTFEEATNELVRKHPEWEVPIRAWYDRWQETITGPIQDTVEILRELKEAKSHRLLALTNWSAETFPTFIFCIGSKALLFQVLKKRESLSRNFIRSFLIVTK
jgi:2-haloacid dehalogenase